MKSSAYRKEIKIGISAITNYSSPLIYNALGEATQRARKKDSEKYIYFEYFEEGIAYISGGIPKSSTTNHKNEIIKLVNLYFQKYSGLIIPGNNDHINPAFFSGTLTSGEINYSRRADRRIALEIELINEALKRGFPVMGICGGHQVICVALGGVVKDTSELMNNDRIPIAFTKIGEQENSSLIAFHANTILHSIVEQYEKDIIANIDGTVVIEEHSSHFQAVDPSLILSSPMVITEAATDSRGIIKAIEINYHPFMIGMQFHPENDANIFDTRKHNLGIFIYFIEVCKQYAYKSQVLTSIHDDEADLRDGCKRTERTIIRDLIKLLTNTSHENQLNIFRYETTYKDLIFSIHELMLILNEISKKNRFQFIKENVGKFKVTFGACKVLLMFLPENQRLLAIDELFSGNDESLFNCIANFNRFFQIYSLLAINDKNTLLNLLIKQENIMALLGKKYLYIFELFSKTSREQFLNQFKIFISHKEVKREILKDYQSSAKKLLPIITSAPNDAILDTLALLCKNHLFQFLNSKEANELVFNVLDEAEKLRYIEIAVLDILNDNISFELMNDLIPKNQKENLISSLIMKDSKLLFIKHPRDAAIIMSFINNDLLRNEVINRAIECAKYCYELLIFTQDEKILNPQEKEYLIMKCIGNLCQKKIKMGIEAIQLYNVLKAIYLNREISWTIFTIWLDENRGNKYESNSGLVDTLFLLSEDKLLEAFSKIIECLVIDFDLLIKLLEQLPDKDISLELIKIYHDKYNLTSHYFSNFLRILACLPDDATKLTFIETYISERNVSSHNFFQLQRLMPNQKKFLFFKPLKNIPLVGQDHSNKETFAYKNDKKPTRQHG